MYDIYYDILIFLGEIMYNFVLRLFFLLSIKSKNLIGDLGRL